jgi:hypothetical protein
MSDNRLSPLTFNWQPGLLHEMSNRLGSEVHS